MKCLLCDSPAVAIFDMAEGFARDPEKTQALCSHHAFKATPQEGMMLIKDLTDGETFTDIWVSGRVFPEDADTVVLSDNELRVLAVLDECRRECRAGHHGGYGASSDSDLDAD